MRNCPDQLIHPRRSLESASGPGAPQRDLPLSVILRCFSRSCQRLDSPGGHLQMTFEVSTEAIFAPQANPQRCTVETAGEQGGSIHHGNLYPRTEVQSDHECLDLSGSHSGSALFNALARMNFAISTAFAAWFDQDRQTRRLVGLAL